MVESPRAQVALLGHDELLCAVRAAAAQPNVEGADGTAVDKLHADAALVRRAVSARGAQSASRVNASDRDGLLSTQLVVGRPTGLLPLYAHGVVYEADDSGAVVRAHSMGDGEHAVVVLGNTCVESDGRGVFYFEVDVASAGASASRLAVGLLRPDLPVGDVSGPGVNGSFLFESSGRVYTSASDEGRPYGPQFSAGDVVGCGWDLVRQRVFFTVNGAFVDIVSDHVRSVSMIPSVMMASRGASFRVNFGAKPFLYNVEGALGACETRVAEVQSSRDANRNRLARVLVAMGFPLGACLYALRINKDDVGLASAWLADRGSEMLAIASSASQRGDTRSAGPSASSLQPRTPTVGGELGDVSGDTFRDGPHAHRVVRRALPRVPVATQSSTIDGAERALLDNALCSSTGVDHLPGPFWEVDLNDVFSVASVDIHPRDAAIGPAILFVSQTRLPPWHADGSMCPHWYSEDAWGTFDGGMYRVATGGVRGRFIRLQSRVMAPLASVRRHRIRAASWPSIGGT